MSDGLARRPVHARLLGRILDDPELPARVRALDTPLLRRIVLRVGLEDAGELVALASAEQLRELFDEDLWRSARPGADEAFDAERFALWLEVLVEGGEELAADRLSRFSEEFLALAFSRLVRVIDTAWVLESDGAFRDAAELDRLLDTALCGELDTYLVLSRIEHGWDAVWATLLALDASQPALLRSVLQRCSVAMQGQMERAGGLHEALSEEEALLEDVRAERDERRAGRGYVAPADARAFLALAHEERDPFAPDPIARGYFRDLERVGRGADVAPAATSAPGTPLHELLAQAGDPRPRRPKLAEGPSLLRRVVSRLLERDPTTHQRVVDELTFLANVLVAGDTSRSWAPADAAQEVLALCDAGLLRLVASEGQDVDSETAAMDLLRRAGAVAPFRIGWRADPTRGL